MKTLLVTLSILLLPAILISQESLPFRYFSSADAQEFKSSPCWEELGYNPDMPKELTREMYKHCEDEKRKKENQKILYFFIGFLVLGLLIWLIVYFSNSNKRMWEALNGKYDTDKDFKEIISTFFIPDRISFKKYIQNKLVHENPKDKEELIPSYSYNKYLLNETFEKPNFPSWFFAAYSDVTVWFQKNKDQLLDKYNSTHQNEFLRKIVDHFKSEFHQLELLS